MKISLCFVIGIILVVGGNVLERGDDGIEDKRLLDAIEDAIVDKEEHSGFPTRAMVNEGAYQGDMMLDDDQWEIVRAAEDDNEATSLGKRKALAAMSKRWPNSEIPYYIDSDVEAYYGTEIAAAITKYESDTCLDFIKHSTVPSGGYVHVKSGLGCSSKVGYKNAKRALTLNLGGCRAAIAHEFGHAIGFKHEHVRPDRDNYVTIRTENIITAAEGSFTKLTTDVINTYGVEYDYKSAMHYSSKAFSSNGQPTIVTINPLDMIDVGINEEPNFSDMKLINLMYDCSSGCSTVTCNNGGYQDKTCNCVCAPGWSGSDCSTSETLPDDCKNTITSGSGEITSENYPSNYPQDHTCQWYFKGTAGQTITVTFVDFELEDANVGVCDDDFLEIRTTDLYYGGDKYCGSTAPSTQVVTSSSDPPEMLFFFQSDTNSVVKKGFKFTYSIS